MFILENLKKELRSYAKPEKIPILQNFFKTGKGEYGEGDIFIGLNVPDSRKVTKKYFEIELEDVEKLLDSKIHEERLVAVLILVEKYKNSSDKNKIFDFYLKNAKKINNWDLVDLSAPKIAGDFLFDKDKSILYKFSKSENLWERRISIISTYYFIKNNEFKETFKISEILLNDKHDLIHKAVGWMLREVGKKNVKYEENFLKKYYKKMPRTMLRYAIEKFPEEKRKKYLNGEI